MHWPSVGFCCSSSTRYWRRFGSLAAPSANCSAECGSPCWHWPPRSCQSTDRLSPRTRPASRNGLRSFQTVFETSFDSWNLPCDLRERGVVRNLLIETQARKPAPRRCMATLRPACARCDAVQIADQQMPRQQKLGSNRGPLPSRCNCPFSFSRQSKLMCFR